MNAPLTGAFAPLALRLDPSLIMSAGGMTPDLWQSKLIRDTENWWLLLCCRQSGKTMSIAALALATALNEPAALVLILTPSERQSKEVLLCVSKYYLDLFGVPFRSDAITTLKIELPNGSRVIALPGSSEKTIRVYAGVDLLLVDEGARVPDDLFHAVTPMLAVSGGRLIMASTPFFKRGYFFEQWTNGGDRWRRVKITAADCPRIKPKFLASEKKSMPHHVWMQEYFCVWGAAAAALFDPDACDALLSKDVVPYIPNRLRFV